MIFLCSGNDLHALGSHCLVFDRVCCVSTQCSVYQDLLNEICNLTFNLNVILRTQANHAWLYRGSVFSSPLQEDSDNEDSDDYPLWDNVVEGYASYELDFYDTKVLRMESGGELERREAALQLVCSCVSRGGQGRQFIPASRH